MWEPGTCASWRRWPVSLWPGDGFDGGVQVGRWRWGRPEVFGVVRFGAVDGVAGLEADGCADIQCPGEQFHFGSLRSTRGNN